MCLQFSIAHMYMYVLQISAHTLCIAHMCMYFMQISAYSFPLPICACMLCRYLPILCVAHNMCMHLMQAQISAYSFLLPISYLKFGNLNIYTLFHKINTQLTLCNFLKSYLPTCYDTYFCLPCCRPQAIHYTFT